MLQRNSVSLEQDSPIVKRPISLESSLSPLWKISNFGLLLPWCHSSEDDSIQHENRLVKTIRYLTVSITVLISLLYTTFITVQLVWAVEKAKTFYDVLPNLMWGIPVYIVLITQADYFIRRNEYLSFFNLWKSRLESQRSLSVPKTNLKRACIIIYTGHFITFLGLMFNFTWIIFFVHEARVEKPILLLDYPVLVEIFSAPVLFLFTVLAFCIPVCFFFTMGDVVPSFVYHHAAGITQILESDIQCLSASALLSHKETELEIQRIWTLYDTLCHLVSKADRLFGSLVVLHQGVSFVSICALLFNLLSNKDQLREEGVFGIFLLVIFIFSFRLLWTITMTAQLYCSSDRLRAAVASLLSHRWISGLSEPQRSLVQHFLVRLEHDHLAAYPWSLYKIKPSILMTMLSLVATYTIILLQSR